MEDQKLSQLDPIPVVDRTTNKLYIVDGNNQYNVTPNNLLGIAGNPVGTSDIQTLTNKTLTSPSITTPTLTVNDDSLTIRDNADTTKQARFQLSGITTGQTRTMTLPDADATLVGTATTQTLTNKTLTSPTINNPILNVDTISEFTSANGVTIDGLNIKDGGLTGAVITPANLVAGTGSSWAWQSWTPSWTNLTVGNGTVVAFRTQIGKTVIGTISLVFGSTTSVTGGIAFSFPITAAARYSTRNTVGHVYALDATGSDYPVELQSSSTTLVSLNSFGAGGTYLTYGGISSTVPFTWAVNDAIRGYFIYEAA